MPQVPSIEQWLDAVIDATDDLATTMLGLSGSTLVDKAANIPSTDHTAIISVVGNDTSIQMGISTSATHCHSLIKAMMGMSPEEPDLEEDEVTDAFGEITNILAGQVKTIIAQSASDNLNIGIPVFIKGSIAVSDSTEVLSANVLMEDIPAVLLVIKGDPPNGG